MEVYVKAPSKKALNELLQANDTPITFVEYRMLDENHYSFNELPEGTLVKVWSKQDPWGTPIAKSYGIVRGGKVQ